MINEKKRLTLDEVELISSYMWKILYYCSNRFFNERERMEEISSILKEARENRIELIVDENKCVVYFPIMGDKQ